MFDTKPSPNPEHVIETEALTKCYGRKLALRNLGLRVSRGGVHALVGSNGAGKSTLFRILLGILGPSHGCSRVLGVDSTELDPETRGRIGLVTEEHTLPAWMSVRSLVTLQRSMCRRWCQHTFDEVLGHFNVLPEQEVKQLSRGERAGVSLALALAQRPELLILDEPTLGLDVVAKQAVLESLLFTGERDDCTIVYCSHQMDEVERLAEYLIILEAGELVWSSSPEELWQRVSCWTLAGFAETVTFDAIPGLLSWRTVDDREEVVVLDQDDTFGQCLRGLGASDVHRRPIGFDRAVNAYLSRNHTSPSNPGGRP